MVGRALCEASGWRPQSDAAPTASSAPRVRRRPSRRGRGWHARPHVHEPARRAATGWTPRQHVAARDLRATGGSHGRARRQPRGATPHAQVAATHKRAAYLPHARARAPPRPFHPRARARANHRRAAPRARKPSAASPRPRRQRVADPYEALREWPSRVVAARGHHAACQFASVACWSSRGSPRLRNHRSRDRGMHAIALAFSDETAHPACTWPSRRDAPSGDSRTPRRQGRSHAPDDTQARTKRGVRPVAALRARPRRVADRRRLRADSSVRPAAPSTVPGRALGIPRRDAANKATASGSMPRRPHRRWRLAIAIDAEPQTARPQRTGAPLVPAYNTRPRAAPCEPGPHHTPHGW